MQNSIVKRAVFAEHLGQVQRRMRHGALGVRRSPQSLRLIAVSKQQSVPALRSLAALGVRDFAENYLQEALAKQQMLADLPLTWHFIGRVQSNKARQVAEHFRWVHTVDRLKIARRLSDARPCAAPPLELCVQVNLDNEPGKGGVAAQDVAPLISAMLGLPRIRVRGLMAIPAVADDYGAQLAAFTRLADLLRSLRHLQQAPAGASGSGSAQLDVLSMGMSNDLEAAVEAGATHLRIGRALFGGRDA